MSTLSKGACWEIFYAVKIQNLCSTLNERLLLDKGLKNERLPPLPSHFHVLADAHEIIWAQLMELHI